MLNYYVYYCILPVFNALTIQIMAIVNVMAFGLSMEQQETDITKHKG